MRRTLLLAAALTIPVSGVSLALSTGQAGAAGAKIVCTSMNGTASSSITISGCTGGNTGGSSQPISALALANGGTVNWVSGSNTTFAKPTLTPTSAKHCPGYVKNGTNNPTADKFAGAVTADTGDGIKVPGKYQGAVCISPTGSITAAKPLKAS